MKRPQPSAYYPAFLNIHGKRCVVVGGGTVALRKVKVLLDCGADVTVVSPTLHSDLAQLAEAKGISVICRDFETGDLKNAFIAIAATNRSETNQKVTEEAKKRGILVNVVDSLGESAFIIPSLFRRGDLAIAISTAGASPALARKVRTFLEQSFGEEYTLLLSLVKEVRSALKKKGVVVSADAWQEALDLDFLIELLRTGQREKAKAVLLSNLEEKKESR